VLDASGDKVDVLFVNGSAGDVNRVVGVSEGDDLFAAIVAPPAGGDGRFFVHAVAGDDDVATSLPFDLGDFCFPVLLGEGAEPLAVWNAIGRESRIGGSAYFGEPIPDPGAAPEVFFVAFGGDPANLPAGTVLTLQGAIVDSSVEGRKPIRVTNAVTLEVR